MPEIKKSPAISSRNPLQEILEIAPEWTSVLDSLLMNVSFPKEGLSGKTGTVGPFELFEHLGAKALYKKALGLKDGNAILVKLIRDQYYQPLYMRMLGANQNLRRFFSQRRIPSDSQRSLVMSLSVELAQKMEGVLVKHLSQSTEDGFKVLLPAYAQRTVHNAVIDYIRDEWEWERQTLQDVYLDPEQDDPRQHAADDLAYTPENRALSNEQVTQLNQVRSQLQSLIGNKAYAQEPLYVIDCLFGLGLTPHSRVGEEMTMRECCDHLNIGGETQARRIARCQVLLDKGLHMIRQLVREKLPGVIQAWQAETNVNSASRRELTHQLDLTEGEVERIIINRQYYALMELVERLAVKANRLPELERKGAVAVFVPVDINSATTRDMIDILGLDKETAQKIATQRPFEHLSELINRKFLQKSALDKIMSRGAVLKTRPSNERPDLNKVELSELVNYGLPQPVADRLTRGRPFSTWSEVDDYLSSDSPTWELLRKNFCLGLASH